MKFTIVVHSAPYSSQAAHTAFKFCQAVLNEGHEIYRLFFFRDGVQNLSELTVVAQDELNLQSGWNELISHNNIDAIACVTSALRHGVIDKQEAERYEKHAHNLTSNATIAGLGQLVDASLNSDRLINFG